MPDRDDMPGLGPDPIDKAYLRAEQALDDEAARAARRASVLAAVREAETPAAPAVRSPFRRYGGWLAAACVAGLSVVTAEQVYRLAPRGQPGAPPAAESSPPALAKAPAPPRPPQAADTAPKPPPRLALRQAAPHVQDVPVSPPADIAAPPPLPIPPVEKPLAPPPPSMATAPALADAQLRAAVPNAQSKVEESVVTTTRQGRPSAAALTRAAPKALDGAANLRAAAAAGRTTEIEALLAQGVPIDAADDNGETALMKSIEANQLDAVVLLRRHEASLDQKNHAGVSARDMAAQKNDLSLNAALALAP